MIQTILDGLLTVIEELSVKTVIISKQEKISENYKKFLEITKQKNIKVLVVKSGDRINVEETTYFDILFPEKEQIKENILNNNSIVAKLVYRNFSILFTGDIEKLAEEKIVKKYQGTNKLKANILKIAHHGSKGSTTESFLHEVDPEIALIGVRQKQ